MSESNPEVTFVDGAVEQPDIYAPTNGTRQTDTAETGPPDWVTVKPETEASVNSRTPRPQLRVIEDSDNDTEDIEDPGLRVIESTDDHPGRRGKRILKTAAVIGALAPVAAVGSIYLFSRADREIEEYINQTAKRNRPDPNRKISSSQLERHRAPTSDQSR